MKKILFLSAILAWIFMQDIHAKNIYLSATGNDVNDGLTATTAVKTLTRVNEIINTEDVVHVSGIIKITDEPDFATKIQDGAQDPPAPENGIYLYHRGYFFRNAIKLAGITFLGEDPATDGFSGENVAPLFQFQGAYPVTFKNIKLCKAVTHRAANGQYGSDVSAVWAVGTEIVFDNCIITQNDISRKEASPADPKDGWGNRGAVLIEGGPAVFKNCEFTENLAQEGGCLYFCGGTAIIENCYFGYNNCAEINDSKGAAIHTWVHGNSGPLTLNISKCTFEGNTARKGAAIALLDKVSYTNTSTTIHIDRCAFIGNQATQSQGGAILWDNFMGTMSHDNITITNSLFYGNSANDYGGAFCIWNVQPGSVLTMNNVTMYGNFTNGNSGHGPCLSFMTGYETYLPANLDKHIYNSIFDGNYALADETGTAFADFTSLYTVEEHPDRFDIKNCYIGHSINMAGRQGIDPSLNYVDYYEGTAYDADFVGFDDPDYYGNNYHAVPLLPESPARTYGDAALLAGERDLSGKPWVVAEGKCAVGAGEVTSQELDDEVDFETAIASPSASPVKLTYANGRLLCVGQGRADASINLYNVMGRKIASGENNLTVPAVAPGIYIATIKVDNRIYNQKIRINGR